MEIGKNRDVGNVITDDQNLKEVDSFKYLWNVSFGTEDIRIASVKITFSIVKIYWLWWKNRKRLAGRKG